MNEIEAIEILKIEKGVAELDISNDDGNANTVNFMNAAGIAIQALQEKLDGKSGNWIPVSEGLPSKMMSYWVACADGSVIQQGGTADLWSINKSEIIAWMPNCKPEPPEEDAVG